MYLRDVLRAFRVFFSFLFRLPRGEVVLLWITRRSLCTLGLAIILVSSWARRPVFVKVFGGCLVELIQGYPPWYSRIILKVLRRARRILPQTDLVARGLVEQLGLPEELVTVFPNFLPDAEREHWDAYMRAYEEAIRATATPEAPWYVVPADAKWFTRLVVAAALIDALEGLDLHYPKVTKAQKAALAVARKALV